jgi:outer membrane protein, heavy metal efflux system
MYTITVDYETGPKVKADRTMNGTKLILLAMVLLTGISLSADGQPGPRELPGASLEDLIVFAEQNNPGLRAAYERTQAADQRIRSAGALPDPMITYGYFLESVETRLGPQEQKLSLVQKIPWISKLGLRRQMARQGVTVAQMEYERQRLRLVRDVKSTYSEYRYLFAAHQVTSENLQLLEQAKQVVRTAAGSGTVSQAALLRIQMNAEELNNSLIRLTEQRLAEQGRLNTLLGRDLSAPLSEPVDLEEKSDRELPLSAAEFEQAVKELTATIFARNPELKSMLAQTEQAHTAVDLAHRSYFPDLALGIHYIQTGDAMDPAVDGSGSDPLLATVSFGLPLWPGNHSAVRQEARHNYAAARARQEGLKNDLAQRLETVLVSWRDAARQVALYEDKLVPLAEQVYRITSSEFTTGQEDYLGLLSAQRELLKTHLALHRVIANRDQRHAELERLVGGDLYQ